MAKVELKKINKVYPPGVRAVLDADITINDKEFVVFVGPSGCGKSTTLRMIAGLEEISSGELLIDGARMNSVAAKNRDIAMVFQNYALYPHMTVYDNMAFGLKIQKVPKREIERRVRGAAEILNIVPYLGRRPKALSGGQRQRVAVGRAIVREPKVFLFDEPLSNLDAQLRVQMRTEISALHSRLEATMVYVTHDQVEAMTMGDKIVVMKDGVIQQTGAPKTLYNAPGNLFVASFIGSPPMNFFNGRLVVREDGVRFASDRFELRVDDGHKASLAPHANREVVFGIRPEDLTPHYEAGGQNAIEATISLVEFLGSEINIYAHAGENGKLVVIAGTEQKCKAGDAVFFRPDMRKAHFFSSGDGVSLLHKDCENRR